MSKIEIDNKWIADYKIAVKIIKSEINEQLPKFELIKENSERKTNYYYLKYEYKNLVLTIGGERGELIIIMIIDDKPINVFDVEKIKELYAASENNFIILIGLLKDYLEENKLI